MLRAGALPVREARCIEWREGEKECPCGEGGETVDHFLLTCPRVSGMRDPYVDSGGEGCLTREMLCGYEGSVFQKERARIFLGRMWRVRASLERSDAAADREDKLLVLGRS